MNTAGTIAGCATASAGVGFEPFSVHGIQVVERTLCRGINFAESAIPGRIDRFAEFLRVEVTIIGEGVPAERSDRFLRGADGAKRSETERCSDQN